VLPFSQTLHCTPDLIGSQLAPSSVKLLHPVNLIKIGTVTFLEIQMKMKNFFPFWVIFYFLTSSALCWAQTKIKVDYTTGPGTPVEQVEAVFRSPTTVANGQAILILHHGGGYGANTTQQYAEMFSSNGFATLELIMFQDVRSLNRPEPIAMHGQVMGGLKHLSKVSGVDSKKVSAMGMSLGAFLTIDATSSWFYEHYQAGELRFNKLVALYPVCWMMTEASKGQTKDIPIFKGLPNTFLQQFAEIPLMILAAGKDSYDSLDAGACPTFAKSIFNPRQSAITKVEVFPNATHGWDHGKDYSFPVRGGCTDRTSCTNRTVSSPATVEQGKQAVMSFLTTP
jgi:dienelactone hydrolase